MAEHDRQAWLRSEALRRVWLECPENEYRRFLLRECVEAYLELDEEQQREYERLLNTEPYREVVTMAMTTWEKGLAQGMRQAVRVQLEEKFGALSPSVLQHLDAWPAERLEELLRAVLKASSLQELGLEDNGRSS